MRVRRPRNGGFSLIEALIALIIAILVITFVIFFVGRKLVDDSDPVRAAQEAGYVDPKVLSRHDFSAPFSGCGRGHVSFEVAAWSKDKESKTIAVCCPAWFGPCEIKE